MGTRFQHLRRDERGMSFVWVGDGLHGVLRRHDAGHRRRHVHDRARRRRRTAADAGALAGATALVFDDYDDRSATGPAVMSAMNTAKDNDVMRDRRVGGARRRHVPARSGRRRQSRARQRVPHRRPQQPGGDADRADLRHSRRSTSRRTATAEASTANAHVLREAVHHSGPLGREHAAAVGYRTSTFERYDSTTATVAPERRRLLPARAARTTRATTRYADKGLRADHPRRQRQQHRAQLLLLVGDAGRQRRQLVRATTSPACNTSVVHMGDPIVAEPGNMVGPTNHGVDDLIARDPNAYWDDVREPVGQHHAARARASSRFRCSIPISTRPERSMAATPI